MGFFGPSREERYRGAAHALHPYGFILEGSWAGGLQAYEPLAMEAQPDVYQLGIRGAIEGARVEAFEYDWQCNSDAAGPGRRTSLVIAIHHPWINGGACFEPDYDKWIGGPEILRALLWIPPFTIIKAFELLEASRNPDRLVGDEKFDRLYKVRAASDEAAQRLIPPALREVVLRVRFNGTVELRPGVLIYSPFAFELDGENAVQIFGIGAAFLGALAPKRVHPHR